MLQLANRPEGQGFFDPVRQPYFSENLTGSKNHLARRGINVGATGFFMKFRGPKALGNRPRKAMVCPTKCPDKGRWQDTRSMHAPRVCILSGR
jgi:hypothetical protein